MRSFETLIVMVGAVAFAAAVAVAAVGDGQSTGARGLHASGQWKTMGKSGRAAQQWNLDALRFENNAIRGRISVADSTLLSDGNVEGQVSGHYVSGTISDDEGKLLVSFEGKITGAGMRGQYRDRSGEVGEWEWRGNRAELDAIE